MGIVVYFIFYFVYFYIMEKYTYIFNAYLFLHFVITLSNIYHQFYYFEAY